MMVVHNELDTDIKPWWTFTRNWLRGRNFLLGNRKFIV